MNKEILRTILLEQKQQLLMQSNGVYRETLKDLESVMNIPHVVVVTGLRRVGKSFLLIQFFKKNNIDYYYCNFEDERFIKFNVKDFNLLYEVMVELFGEKKVFLFDEIQNIEGWERFVRRMTEYGNKFYITGSNASMLSRELGTRLTGRYISINVYPFSFREYIALYKGDFKNDDIHTTKYIAKIKSLFNNYLNDGGLPEYLVYNKNKDILKNIYDDILYRDIIIRYKISATQTFRELSLYLISNVSGLYTNNNLRKFLTLGSINTLKDYIGYLENTFLFFTVKQFNKSLKVQFLAPKKIYTIDIGLLNTIAFKTSIDNGKLLENLVYIELCRRKNEIYYYKTQNGFEIDFITRKNNIFDMIQVCWTLQDQNTKNREIRALVEGMKEMNIQKALIISQDDESHMVIDGKEIDIKPIHKWLLDL